MNSIAHEYLPAKPSRKRQPARWHYPASGLISLFGIACTCVSNTAAGYVFAKIDKPDVTFAFTREEFELFQEGPDYDFEADGLDPLRQATRLEKNVDVFADLPQHKRILAENKLAVVKDFLAAKARGAVSRYKTNLGRWLEEKQATINAAALRPQRGGTIAAPFKLVGPKQFLKWCDAYLAKGPLGLLDQYHNCGNRDPRYSGDETAVLNRFVYAYLSPERPTVALLYGDMEKEFGALNLKRRPQGLVDLRCPSRELLRTEIRGLPPFDVIAARHGEEAAKRFFHPSSGGVRNLERPLERVEADDWNVHLHVLLEQAQLWDSISPELQEEAAKTRCVLSAAICCTTRVIPAVTLSLNTSTANTKALLRMCLSDKTPLATAIGCETPWEYRGTVGEFVVDEGNTLNNAEIHTLCDDLGIAFTSPQIETPQQRAKVERFFQTLEIRSLLRFSGRAFSNPVVRGAYKAYARRCVTVEELAALIVRFIVDQYHNLEHAGLSGKTPRQRWLELTKKGPAPYAPPGSAMIRRAFGEILPAILHPQGIEIFGNWYGGGSEVVAHLFQTRAQRDYLIKVDPEDLGAISLRVDGGWQTLAGPEVMRGVSITVWDATFGDLRRQNRDLRNLLKPVVHRAIAFAQSVDAESRKRLSILYRPKTAEEIAEMRARFNETVRYAADRPMAPRSAQGPVDILSGRIAVGTKAGPASTSPIPTAEEPAKSSPARPKKPIAKTKTATKSVVNSTGRTAKPPRPWKPKERK